MTVLVVGGQELIFVACKRVFGGKDIVRVYQEWGCDGWVLRRYDEG